MLRKIILPLIAAAVLLSGCDAVEVSSRSFVSAVFVDKARSEYTVTCLYTDSKGNENVLSTSGKSVAEAIENADLLDGVKLFLGHCRVVFVGSGISDFKSEMRYFADSSILSPDAYFCRCDNVSAVCSENSGLTYTILKNAVSNGTSPNGSTITVFSSECPAVPFAEFDGSNVRISGGEILSSGKRLSPEECLGAGIFSGSVKSTSVIVGTTPVKLDKIGSSVSSEIYGNKILFKVEINVDGTSESVGTSELDRLTAEKLAEDVLAAVSTAKSDNSDFLDINGLVRKQNPQYAGIVGNPLDNAVFAVEISSDISEKRSY